ncbi:hypothetical protein, partial [Planktothrix sp. FACHB-1355]|uniref:hypothetical protein n=1 Tax=Planktothrix sp. FACHB-1355 TaxID=2692854 RepID=UPI001A7ED090
RSICLGATFCDRTWGREIVGAKHLGDNLCNSTRIFISKCFALSSRDIFDTGDLWGRAKHSDT